METKTVVDKESQKIEYYLDTLGRFNVYKAGRSLVDASSGSKKIWELYKFMLTHRERSFTPEALMDQLWATEEYSDPRSTLRRQMHRLRKSLNEDSIDDDYDRTILFINGYYKWNDRIFILLDTNLFERYIKEGNELFSEAPDKALSAYQKAICLYIGDYLPDLDHQHWVFSVRNQYRRMYLNTVLKTIQLLKLNGAYEEIMHLCQKAIHIDVYEEFFHISLMDAMLCRGEQRLAADHYEYVKNFYEQEMGIKPSDEMRKIYKRLIQQVNTIESKESLQEALGTHERIENAFYCEPDVFKSIYELERRRSQRSGEPFSIGVLTLAPVKGDTFSQKEIRMGIIHQKLLEKLRKGDTFARWNDSQFMVLLPGVDADVFEKVLKRVLEMEIERSKITMQHITHLQT